MALGKMGWQVWGFMVPPKGTMCARNCPNTDGLAALRALKSYIFTSQLVAECLDNLIGWPQSEPFFGDSSIKYKPDLNEWIPSDSLAKHFLSYSNKRTEQILNLTKTEIKTLTGILTEHCGLRYHMHRIGKSLNDTCRLCIARIRLEKFGNGFMSPQTVKSLEPKSILGFFKSCQAQENLAHKRSCWVEVRLDWSPSFTKKTSEVANSLISIKFKLTLKLWYF
jgi:hypothetical protein